MAKFFRSDFEIVKNPFAVPTNSNNKNENSVLHEFVKNPNEIDNFESKLNANSIENPDELLVETRVNENTRRFTSIVQVTARNPKSDKKIANAYVLLDTGANHTLVSNQLAKKLGLHQLDAGWMVFTTVNNTDSRQRAHVEIELEEVERFNCDVNSDRKSVVLDAVVVDNLPLGAFMANPDCIRVNIDLIIGQEYLWSIWDLKSITRVDCGLVRIQTIFGPVYCGVLEQDKLSQKMEASNPSLIMTIIGNVEESDFWALERIGIDGDMNTNAESILNEEVVAEFERTVKIINDDIFVCFPWKSDAPIIADNYSLAKRRLGNQLKILDENEDVKMVYHNEFVKQIEKGILEVAPKIQTGRIRYYIPHHGVVKPDSLTTKLRIVLDASSHMKGELSLNDIMHTGPQLVPGMIGVLLRARLCRILLIADVEKAFHQVKLHDTERDEPVFSG